MKSLLGLLSFLIFDAVYLYSIKDYYGKQMGFMARILQDDKKIRDLVAYMNTF